MFPDALQERVAANVREVLDRIGQAARRSGRNAEQVRLVAVSKYAQIGDGMIDALLAAGCRDLGEARPQLLVEKADYYSKKFSDENEDRTIRWHLIGSLQRNKARKVLARTALIHSVDSLRLAEALDRIAAEEADAGLENGACKTPVSCLLEIDVSGDENKHGFDPTEIPRTIEKLTEYSNLRVEGLMCMSGLESTEDQTRREFESLRLLAESLKKRGLPANVSVQKLSMGMSDDFEIAVEEGSTLVRVGSFLYR